MTGYGKASAIIANKKVTVEVKSVNSKQLDLQTKVCPQYRELEMQMRQLVQREMQRGKVDLMVTVEQLAGSAEMPQINVEVVKDYFAQLKSLRSELGLGSAPDSEAANALLLQTLVRLPDAVSVKAQVVEPEELTEVAKLVAEAVKHLVEFRQQEGASLARVFGQKIANIRELLAQVEPYEKERTERIRQNLLDRLEKLPVDYDKNRLEQEMIYYIEKLDINEEKHRLDNHLNYFVETMEAVMDAGGHGKKLGFIAQEMGREINTLGSKSNQAEMQRIVVRMKDELEQIKEQVLNVL